MARTDTGHNLTEVELGKLQRRIERVYKEASVDVGKTAQEYWGKLEKRDAEMRKHLEAGDITDAEYQIWMRAQIGRGKNFEALRDKLAERMADAEEVAIGYVNDATPGIYSINRNYAAYTIEQSGANIDFTLWDENTVRRMLVENPDLMPNYPVNKAIDRGINLAYGKRQIQKTVQSGIMQGLSIPQMAKMLQESVVGMSKTSAIRAARTATTGAENAGRMDSFNQAESMGIKMEKEWMATRDSRTRDSHAKLDGTHVPNNKSFPNRCKYPGDPAGPAGEVYNCRCTLVAWFPEIAEENNKRYTYKDWVAGKEKTSSEFSQTDVIGEKSTIDAAAINSYIDEMNIPRINGIAPQSSEELKAMGEKPENIATASKAIDKLLDDYCSRRSKWSGKTIIEKKNNMPGVYGRKEWNCDITLREDASTKAIIHEHLHARSISYYNSETYERWGSMEESTIELYAIEICKENGIAYSISKSYEKQVRALQGINSALKLQKNSFDFARLLIEMPVGERYNYLDEQAKFAYESHKISKKKYDEINSMIELLGEYK